MKNLLKHKIFIGAFLTSYFLFFAVTVFILDFKRAGVGVGHAEHGFPFAYYYSNCFGGHYSWLGLTGNILTAAIVSGVIGLIPAHFWMNWLVPFGQTVSSSEFRAKWHI